MQIELRIIFFLLLFTINFCTTAADKYDIETRLQRAIINSQSFKVTKADLLGEGSGKWDSDPRYPQDNVNCITWIQYLIAETYGVTADEKLKIMDAVRYFGSHVSWGSRIHYLDHWVLLEPGPLQPIQNQYCGDDLRIKVHLDVARFRNNMDYPCPVYGQQKDSFYINFMSAKASKNCATELPEGYYIAFPIAGPRYIKTHGKNSGSMGRVHGLIMELRGPPRRNLDYAEFTHASTSEGIISQSKLTSYLSKMENIFLGYEYYRLDPTWTPTKNPIDSEISSIYKCEMSLPMGYNQ